MRLIRIMVLLGVFFSMAFYLDKSFAQEQNPQDLIKNFNFEDLPAQDLQTYSKDLEGYFMCMAAIRNDVSLCENLRNSSGCRQRFRELHGFYRQLIASKAVSQSAIDDLVSSGKERMDPEQARAIANSFLAKDAAFCKDAKTLEGKNICKAIILRNPQLCSGEDCINQVYYIKALEESNIQTCDKIKDEGVKMLCKGEFFSDQEKCKQCSGFKNFIDQYYKLGE